ncbi:MAG: homocysteine S-methyltransferase family protein [Phycisphaerae bacterium]|jgi:homocysteine S-methyltransferase
MTARFVETLRQQPVILAEGAVIERLRRDGAMPLDPHVLHAGFVYDDAARAALQWVYQSYLDAGRAAGLPLIVLTPTWRANPERLRAAGLADRDVNGDATRFLAGLRAQCGEYASNVFVGGLMGCRGDAYDPRDAFTERDAADFHRSQAQALADAGVDFLMAATLPAASEALGIARAMAVTAVPYIVSFIVRPAGTLLDGTPIADFIARLDTDVRPAPAALMVNCVHPTVLEAALDAAPQARDRIIGLQANTSRRGPEQLDDAAELDTEKPAPFADAMLRAHRRFGLRILGGCCGTDDRHIRAIAERVKLDIDEGKST